jgi:hypothetical protein
MPDLTWTVKVDRWTWIYKFSHAKSVTWRDPWNGMNGRGTWNIIGDTLKIRWQGSETIDEWDVPFEPRRATGQTTMKGVTYDLVAVATDFFLKPGDVVYSGQNIVRGNGTAATIIYDDEVRTGGTVAWICRNPGNIREGERFGAFKGKQLHVIKAGAFAIFPDEGAGLIAVVKVLRGYGRVTISQAITKYAPPWDHNKTEDYIASVAGGLHMSADTYLTTLSDEQVLRMATVMTGVESTKPGGHWAIDDSSMPADIWQRVQSM